MAFPARVCARAAAWEGPSPPLAQHLRVSLLRFSLRCWATSCSLQVLICFSPPLLRDTGVLRLRAQLVSTPSRFVSATPAGRGCAESVRASKARATSRARFFHLFVVVFFCCCFFSFFCFFQLLPYYYSFFRCCFFFYFCVFHIFCFFDLYYFCF